MLEIHFTGRSVTDEQGVEQADIIVIGKLIDIGTPQPGAPGETHYEKAKIELIEPIKDGDSEPVEVSINFTVQKMPAEVGEKVPEIGNVYLFFIKKSTQRGFKILPATEGNRANIIRLIALHQVNKG